jgi:hypothetical protein
MPLYIQYMLKLTFEQKSIRGNSVLTEHHTIFSDMSVMIKYVMLCLCVCVLFRLLPLENRMSDYLEVLFDYERSGFNHIGVLILGYLDYRSLVQV